MAIKKFKEMSKRFDQSNRTGAMGRIMNLLNKKRKFYEVLAWYTTSKRHYLYMDETSYFKVIKAVLFFAFSQNAFITSKDLIKMLSVFGSKWELSENEKKERKAADNSEIESLVCSLKKVEVVDVEQDRWYYSKENCLNDNSYHEEFTVKNPSKADKFSKIDGPDYIGEIKGILDTI